MCWFVDNDQEPVARVQGIQRISLRFCLHVSTSTTAGNWAGFPYYYTFWWKCPYEPSYLPEQYCPPANGVRLHTVARLFPHLPFRAPRKRHSTQHGKTEIHKHAFSTDSSEKDLSPRLWYALALWQTHKPFNTAQDRRQTHGWLIGQTAMPNMAAG